MPTELPKTFNMRLKCGKCGHTADYQLTKIIISPAAAKAKNPTESISFGDYFRCRQCQSAWPWEFTGDAHLTLTGLLANSLAGNKDERIIFGIPQLFDGTPFLSAAQAEEHLLGLLEREPENSFVWDRLGNVYEQAGMTEKAKQAFVKALEVDPKNIESHYSLGYQFFDEGRLQEAAQYFHQVITFAREYQHLPEKRLRETVYDTLGVLVNLAVSTNGEIPVLPVQPLEPSANPDKPALIYLTEFDLAKESERQRLVDLVLGKGRAPIKTPKGRQWISKEVPARPGGRVRNHKRHHRK